MTQTQTIKGIILPAHQSNAAYEGRLGQVRVPLKRQPEPSIHGDGVWLMRTGRDRWTTNERRVETVDFSGPVVARDIREVALPLSDWLLDFTPWSPGDVLAVRETWALGRDSLLYRAENDTAHRWRSPVTMPLWAARTHLLVKRVWVERVQDIACNASAHLEGYGRLDVTPKGTRRWIDCLAHAREYWDAHHKPPHRWADNPWTPVAEVERTSNPKEIR